VQQVPRSDSRSVFYVAHQGVSVQRGHRSLIASTVWLLRYIAPTAIRIFARVARHLLADSERVTRRGRRLKTAFSLHKRDKRGKLQAGLATGTQQGARYTRPGLARQSGKIRRLQQRVVRRACHLSLGGKV
jgi:hypothetical protein